MLQSDSSLPDSSAEPDRDAWYAGYRARCETVKAGVAMLIAESISGERSFAEAAASLRALRAGHEHRFCLLLYGKQSDETVLRELGESIGLSQQEMADALETGRDPERNDLVTTALMMLLDQELQLPLLLLERDTGLPDYGPIRIRAPDEIWFESFCLLAELADAVIVIGNVNANLIRETRHLTDADLRHRTLIYAGGLLYTFEAGRTLEQQQSWPLDAIGLKAAITFARSGS